MFIGIVGPTAVGKTAAAVSLAEILGGELVSADAVAVYRKLDIGSAKPTAEERARVPFHLIDVADPEEDFTMTDFARLAERSFAEIRGRGKLPILVGGTGLYVRSVTATLSIPNVPPQPELRARLWAEVDALGSEVLHARLAQIDPASAEKILPGDAKRILRALEVFEVTKLPASSFHTPEGVHGVPKPGVRLFGLARERESLYRRIDVRVDEMLASGFLDEVRGLLDEGVSPEAKSLKSLGYKHLVQFLHGDVGWDETVELLKRDTRRFAKRQLTWFRADPAVRWMRSGEDETAEAVARRIVTEVRNESTARRQEDNNDE